MGASSSASDAGRGSIRLNGAELFAEWAGRGSGLLFLHAGVADSRMWDAEFAAFQESHRVVRFDIRGFGRSPMPPGRFAYHDDVLAVARETGLARTTLVGCSFGAAIALDTALAHPALVERLVLVSPSLGGGGDSEEMRRFDAEEEAALERGDLDGATELNLRMWVDGPHRAPTGVDPEVRERVRVMQLDAFRVEMPAGVERDRLEPPGAARLGELRAPTLAVAGALDVPFVLAAAERVEREVKGGRRAVIHGAAHMVNLERPTEFRLTLEDFLRSS
jgi:pimeloyl-ACP methyl ester carboxylesterase